MRRSSGAGAVLMMLAAMACGESRRGPDGPEWLTAPANPVTLETTLEADRAVTRRITPQGGTLIASASDGTRYRLRIPEGALLSSVEITMTPIRSLAGLPSTSGRVAAVQLEPSGLQLMKAAELAITPADSIPLREQLALAWYGAGDDAHQYPLRVDPDRIEMDLLHFSGYGVTQAGPGHPAREAVRHAASEWGRFDTRMAQATEKDRQAGEQMSDATIDLLFQSLVEYYDFALRPLLARAEADYRLADCCIQRWAQWERQLQLIGSTDLPAELQARSHEAAASVQRILQNMLEQGMEHAVQLCREHDLRAVQLMIALERQAALLGAAPDAGSESMWERIFDCLTFEVEFESTFDNSAPASTRLLYEVEATVPLRLEDYWFGGASYANAPLEYRRFHATGNLKEALFGEDGQDERTAWFDALASGTNTAVGTRGSTFTVYAAELDLNSYLPPGLDCETGEDEKDDDPLPPFTLTFSPGIPVEISRHTPTTRSIAPFDLESTSWADHFERSHRNEQTSVPGIGTDDEGRPFRMTLEPVERGRWTLSFDRDYGSASGFSLVESGHITVRHTPQ